MGNRHGPRIEAHLGHGPHGVSETDFTEAARAGASLVEMDVQATTDAHLLVYHNYTLPDGRWVHETDFGDCLEALTDQGGGRHPLLLEEALALAAEHGVGLTLDIKSGMGEEHAVHRLVAEALPRSTARPEIHVCDWDHAGLGIVKAAVPHVLVRGALRGRPVDMIGVARRAGLDGLNLAWDCTRPSDVLDLHAAGLVVAFFGGWGDRYIPYAQAVGVDIVSSDDPKGTAYLL